METLRTVTVNNVRDLVWRAQGDPDQYFVTMGNNWFASIHLNGDIRTVNQTDIMNLIAAAPELLALVQECANFAEVAQRGRQPTSWLVNARKVLKRVQGS